MQATVVGSETGNFEAVRYLAVLSGSFCAGEKYVKKRCCNQKLSTYPPSLFILVDKILAVWGILFPF